MPHASANTVGRGGRDPSRLFTRRVERAVERFMSEEGLAPEEGRILVGVSGGPDSSALLLLLSALAARRGLRLTAAYFDHRLRGAEAAGAERTAVRALASRCGVEMVLGEGDVKGLRSRSKLTLEEAARRARYEFLGRTAEEQGISTVAVGHTADDQAETVLMHIIRGSGLTGLAGMHPRSRWPAAGHPALALVRPLLRLSRAETEAYCEAAGFTPVLDVSNHAVEFLRNRIRRELLPLLRSYNPRITDALVRLADAARADLQALEAPAAAAITQVGEGDVRLGRQVLREMSPSVRRHALRQALLLLAGDLQGFGERHLRALDKLAVAGESGGRLDLPRGVKASALRDAVALTLGGREEAQPLPEAGVRLGVPGEARLGGLVVAARPSPLLDAGASVQVDSQAVGEELCVRSWRPGDRMQPLGMKGTKKLQDLFVDAHVAREERGRVPVFESKRGIVWVGGLRLADWARPREGKATVVLSFKREN